MNQASLGGLCSAKLAFHAHDRMEERTPFHRSYTNQLQLAVDTLKLTGEAYHLPLRDQSGKVVGFAQFKRVPDRKTPVLATVLGPKMKPRGVDVEPKLVWAGQKKS